MDIVQLKFEADTKELSEAEKQLDKVTKQSKAANDSSMGLSKSLTDLASSAGLSSTRIAALATGVTVMVSVATAAVAAVVKMSLAVADAADAMNDLSNRTNINTERLTLLDAMAKMAGSSVEELVGSSERLGQKLAKQDGETGKAVTALKALGVSTKDANGEAKSMLKLQEDIVLAVDAAGNSAKAQGLAVALLGTEYYKLRTPIREAAEQQSEMYDYMSKVGALTSTQLAKDSDTLNDSISKLGLAFSGMGKSIASAVIPYLISVVDWISKISAAAADVIRRFSGNSTASEKSGASLSGLMTDRESAVSTVSKLEGTQYAETAQGAKALEQARARVTSLNEQIREMSRLKGAADTAAAAVKGATTNGTATEGNRVVGSNTKPIDPASTAEYKEAMRVAEARAQLRRNEEEGIKRFALEQMQAANQEFAAEQKRLQTVRERAAAMQSQWDQERAIEEARLEYQQNWRNGMHEAIDEYVRYSKNGADMTRDAFESAIGGMENALVNFSRTGKLNFKDLAGSIISDIVRIQLRAQMSGILGKLFPSLGGGASSGFGTGNAFGNLDLGAFLADGGVSINGRLQKYANGGVFNAPTMFGHSGGLGVLGEAGPEAVMPLKRGANGQLGVQVQGGGSSTGLTIGSINITVEGGQTNDETGRIVGAEVMKTMEQVALRTIKNQQRYGGALYAA